MSSDLKTGQKRHRVRRLSLWLAGLVVIGAIGTEMLARYYLGLGDPPLSMSDPEMAYLFKPNQTCRRFGNLIHYNAYSMRSDDFSARKTDKNEFRVMVIGDSVINGGAKTDQSQVCTSILQKELAGKLHRPVVVGNISAGGWGPLNQWPYVKKYGLFDADAVVIVLSSHDAASIFQGPHVAGVDPSFPDRKPWCATWEAVTRYLPKYLPSLGQAGSNEGFQEGVDDPKVVEQCMTAIKEMISCAKGAGARTYVLLHWTQAELKHAKDGEERLMARPQGLEQIDAAAKAAGAVVVDMRETEEDAGKYQDNIHLNAVGQQGLEATLLRCLASLE